MNVTALAQSMVAFLSPFLPYLLKAVEKGAEEAGEKFGAEAWERAKALWGKLHDRREVKETAQDAAKMPDDPDAQAALRLQLRKLLTKDTTLADEIDRFMRGEVMQRVLAKRGSLIEDVEMRMKGRGGKQKVRAEDDSIISGVKQLIE